MAYQRFCIPPKSFYKTWISHIDAWPLFAANGLGIVLCGYAMYRKCFQNPNLIVSTAESFLDPVTCGSMGEKQIQQIDRWKIWFHNIMGNMDSVSGPFKDRHVNSLGEQLKGRKRSFDRTEARSAVNKDIERPIVPWSPFQEMISIKEVLDSESVNFNEFIVEEAKEAASPVSIDEKKAVMLLAKRADLLGDQFKVLAAETGLFDGNFKGANEYIAKLKSIKDESDITPEVFEAILAPKNSPFFNPESLVSDVRK